MPIKTWEVHYWNEVFTVEAHGVKIRKRTVVFYCEDKYGQDTVWAIVVPKRNVLRVVQIEEKK
jgi:hypothetical protein